VHFVNIHTHIISENKFAVHNLFPEEAAQITEELFYSIGIHPWEVTKTDTENRLRIVEEAAKKKNVAAIGEIGLDKLRDKFDLQKHVFLKQIHIAKDLNYSCYYSSIFRKQNNCRSINKIRLFFIIRA